MDDHALLGFLQWALPRLGMRWPGFRKVRGQVRKRLARRLGELRLDDLNAYRDFLSTHPLEWHHLEGLCRITISRFYRDRQLFDFLAGTILPRLREAARQDGQELRALSLGCASGEEPYTLALLDHFRQANRPGEQKLEIIAVDSGDQLLRRAAQAVYPASSLKELPPAWREAAFVKTDHCFRLRDEIRQRVRFQQADIRKDPLPRGPFQLILCRNLAFTYFDRSSQELVLAKIQTRLTPAGILVPGSHESLPSGSNHFKEIVPPGRVYRLAAGG